MLNKKALSAAFGVEKDANFNQTVLLLHGDGTNGAQNNTFTDSSTNNFTITRNGNTTQGTFSPFSVAAGEWSTYFNGGTYPNGTYYTVSGSADFNFGTGDFTIECFAYAEAGGEDYGVLISNSAGTTTTSWFRIEFSKTGDINFTTGGTSVVSKAGVSLNTWHHICVSRSGTTVRLFIDGVQESSATYSTTIGSDTATIHLGNEGGDSGGLLSRVFKGYISNLRVLKGTGVTSVTVPTSPLTNITNTKLLVFQSNRAIDNSSSNRTLTPVNAPSIQPFSYFAPSAAYSASTNGGSGYFDGNEDFLSGIGTTSDFNFLHNTTALFTIEGWIYTPSFGSSGAFVFGTNSGTGGEAGGVLFYNSSGQLRLIIGGGSGGGVVDGTSSSSMTLNSWNHIAVTYDQSLASANCKFYINGVAAGTANKTANTPSSGNAANVAGIVKVGNTIGDSAFYLSDLRVNNSVVYTAAFTPPTSPLAAITNTKLLTKFQNAAILDNTGKNNLETVGNAQIDTGTKKFGTGSLEFDGTNDALVVSNSVSSPQFEFSGDLTIEGWFYLAGGSGTRRDIIHYDDGGVSGCGIFVNTTNVLWAGIGNYSASSFTPSLSTWYHFALVRSGSASNNCKLYVDGSQVLQFTSTVSVAPNASMYIGATSALDGDFNGFIDDLRITKGVARYTANFTPPAKAFADQ